MKLSEEIRLGSLLVSEPRASDLRACAIGMANLSAGCSASGDEDDAAYAAYEALHLRHPWLIGKWTSCPVCLRKMYGNEAVWHPFDSHVMLRKWHDGDLILAQEMTIEQLADWIASIEPAESEAAEARPETVHSLVPVEVA